MTESTGRTPELNDFDPCIREGWATWEVLRILGFKSDDIFWIWQKTVRPAFKGWALNIVLRTQDMEFVITCSKKLRKSAVPGLMQQAKKFQEKLAAKAFQEEELRATLRASYIWTNAPEFLLALRRNGFVFPYTLNDLN